MAGPDFSEGTKRRIRERADNRCSRPECRIRAVAADGDSVRGVTRLGEVAHIRGARPGSPRHDPAQTDEQRADAENAMFLCETCHRLVDTNNGAGFTVETLLEWKRAHEAEIIERLGKPDSAAAARVQEEIQNMRAALRDACEFLTFLRNKNPGSAAFSWVAELERDRRELNGRIGEMQTCLNALDEGQPEAGANISFRGARRWVESLRLKYRY